MFTKRVVTRYIKLWLVVSCLWPAISVSQTDSEQAQSELKRIQAELESRQTKLKRDQASADDLRKVLRESEVAIGQVAKALNLTQQGLENNRQQQAELTARQAKLKADIKQQQGLLSNQLRSAFMAGHYDYAKMMFYQEDAKTFERVITYYQYLNQARQASIGNFRNDVAELEAVTQTLADKATELGELLQAQLAQRKELDARQSDREQTLAKLTSRIASDAQQIEALQASQQALKQAIEEAQEAARRAAEKSEVILAGLTAHKGNLLTPTDGRVRKMFGRLRQGQVRWKGIIIEADEGDAVKSVSDGRVLYADWLKGFGLVTIVDHGEGYMSVYGHSQALLKQAGDTVNSGEVIALVGRSGGQRYPNLYFEIRHKGKALNPSSWLNL